MQGDWYFVVSITKVSLDAPFVQEVAMNLGSEMVGEDIRCVEKIPTNIPGRAASQSVVSLSACDRHLVIFADSALQDSRCFL